MLFAQTGDVEKSGHVGDPVLSNFLSDHYHNITKIQADGDELARCCEILGRTLPRKSVFNFLGDEAKSIAVNWY